MPNLFEHFATSAAYIHIIFINIVQANEMPNLFEHFTTSAAYIFLLATICSQFATPSVDQRH